MYSKSIKPVNGFVYASLAISPRLSDTHNAKGWFTSIPQRPREKSKSVLSWVNYLWKLNFLLNMGFAVDGLPFTSLLCYTPHKEFNRNRKSLPKSTFYSLSFSPLHSQTKRIHQCKWSWISLLELQKKSNPSPFLAFSLTIIFGYSIVSINEVSHRVCYLRTHKGKHLSLKTLDIRISTPTNSLSLEPLFS